MHGSEAVQSYAGLGARMTPPFQFWVSRACCAWACGSWLIVDLKIILCILFTLCCSWFCLRTVSEEWLILRLFILTHPGEETVAGHLWAFSAPLCDWNPLFCAPRPATLARCQCRGEQWVNTVVLNHFPALRGLLSPVSSQEGVLQSCWLLRRGRARGGCMVFPLAQLGTRSASCHCIGSQGCKCSLSEWGEGYWKVNVICLWGFILLRFILLSQRSYCSVFCFVLFFNLLGGHKADCCVLFRALSPFLPRLTA